MRKYVFVFFFLFSLSILSAKNPVIVGPGGDYLKIQEAIISWCEGGSNTGETPPFIIMIDPLVDYDESLTLDDGLAEGNIVGDLEIKSQIAGAKAVIKLKQGHSLKYDGLHVYQSRFNIIFRDLLFCPSPTDLTMDDDMLKIDENSPSSPEIPNRIDFIDCIFTDINAAGDPVVMSKQDIIDANYPTSLTEYASGSALFSGDNLMKWWGDDGENLSGSLINCGFFIRDGYCARINLDGTSGETFEIRDCVFATGHDWNAALQLSPGKPGSKVLLKGTLPPSCGNLQKCNAILSSGWHTIWCNGVEGADVEIENVLIDVKDVWGTADTRPIRGGEANLRVKEAILCVEEDPGMIVDYPTNPAQKDSFRNVTIFMPGVENWLDTGSETYQGGIDFIDCVFAGAGMGPYDSTVPSLGIHVDYSLIATRGPDGIASDLGSGISLGSHMGIQIRFCDPHFLSRDHNQELFMDIGYRGTGFAASDGSGIRGGANFRGMEDAGDYYWNIFDSFGNCEEDIFTIPSGRSDYKGSDLLNVQDPFPGVIGAGLLIHNTTGRFESGTDIIPVSLSDQKIGFQFYYKFPIVALSYPRLALRLNPTAPPYGETGGQVDDCKDYLEWLNSSFIADENWHLFKPDISSLSWGGVNTVNFFINTCDVPDIFLDEIILGNMNYLKNWDRGIDAWKLY